MCTGRCCSILNAVRTLRRVTSKCSFPLGKRYGRRPRSAVEIKATVVQWFRRVLRALFGWGIRWFVFSVSPPSTNMETVLNDLRSFTLGRDSAVVLAAGIGLDCPRFEPECGRHFPHQYSPSLLYNVYHVLFRDKAAGEWRYHPPQSSAGVEERV